jgi:hypothetical protein
MLSGKLDIKVFTSQKLTPEEPRVADQQLSNNDFERSSR